MIQGCLLRALEKITKANRHNPVTWYGINYAGTQITCTVALPNKENRASPARLSFVLKVPLRYLRPSIIYSVPDLTGSCKGPINTKDLIDHVAVTYTT